MDIQNIKNRYDIIGNDPKLILAINKAIQVAPTDLSILVTGESGVGKEIFARMIHDNSSRKHKKLVSVNCGAIPEGTIESELFGHIKGSFTGADKDRKGYFEEADGGTIFLDEVGELPLAMQVKLLRVLENGEIIPVGSSTARKINVRVVAATNVDLLAAIRKGHYREDLYYRLNQISIAIPPLRERKEDIVLLFRKFASDVAEKYKMPLLKLSDDGRQYLMDYPWYGNVRELKNVTEQIAVVETERLITRDILMNYIHYVPDEKMPVLFQPEATTNAISDRELLLKALSMGQMINEMRTEINNLKQIITSMARQGVQINGGIADEPAYIDGEKYYQLDTQPHTHSAPYAIHPAQPAAEDVEFQDSEVVENDGVALFEREKAAIVRALDRHRGRRRPAAADLGISERTLYRKIKEYGIEY
ncbi:MAG: sigma-54-dependent Fis family transcriptional regulator [Bacteroidales bacterium]|nr:sigma-54-dependent Fis family transcriptional regulator [Bacteroidales bacterium]MBR4716265.1 sigma-54-dependent Fis family transcriptional regulator [Bacteroidales bacterium]